MLVDARQGQPPPASVVARPGIEVLVAGPGEAVDVPADAPEATLFHALVSAASAPMCLWQRSGDLPTPDRVDLMLNAILRLGAPVVAHRPPSPQTSGGSGKLIRIPIEAVARGGTLHPDTIAFRRDIAHFAPTVDQHRHGTRRALLAWAAMRDTVGFLDRALVARPPTPPPEAGQLAQRQARATQAALTVVDTFVALSAPKPVTDLAVRQVLAASERWTWTHWSLLVHRHKPRWTPPEGITP